MRKALEGSNKSLFHTVATCMPLSLSPLVIGQKRKMNSLVWSMPKSSIGSQANSSRNFATGMAAFDGAILSGLIRHQLHD